MSVGPATSEAVRQLGTVVSAVADLEARAVLHSIVERADGPFEVAVVGRLKSGKSTLVNALLGRAVAPTDSGECTRVVTRFLRGDADFVQSIGGDTVIAESPLGNRPVAADTVQAGVDRLDVYLTSAFLDGVVIADTPGRESLEEDTSAQADAFLDRESIEVARKADAVIYVSGSPVLRHGDMDTIDRFITAVGDKHGLSMFIVLNRADQVDGGIAVAQTQATKLAEGPLRGKVAGVVPTSALALQAARCGLVDGQTATDLTTLLTLEPAFFAAISRSEHMFSTFECDVPAATRSQLVSRLGLTAVGVIVEHLRSHPGDHGGAFGALNTVGNAADLDTQLTRLRRRADGLKAAAAVATAKRLAWRTEVGDDDRAVILAAIQRLTASHAYSVVEQLAALEQAHRDPELLADEELGELERLFTPGPIAERVGATSDDVQAAVLGGAGRWQEISSADYDPDRQHIARVARRAYLSLLEPADLMSGAS